MGIRFKASRTGLEPLESRAMLAADLTGTWVGLNLPAVPSGGAMPPVTLHVENTGDAPAAARGRHGDLRPQVKIKGRPLNRLFLGHGMHDLEMHRVSTIGRGRQQRG